MSPTRLAIAALLSCAASVPVLAKDFTLDFDGIPPAGTAAEGTDSGLGSEILGYYDGDAPYDRANPPFLYDVVFDGGTLAINSLEDPDGAGNFLTARTGLSAAGSVSTSGFGFQLGTGVTLASFSVFYNASLGSNPSIDLFSGGSFVSGTQLNLSTCQPGIDAFCGWTEFKLSAAALSGQAIDQVRFSGVPNRFVIDDATLSTVTATTPIPEPSTYALMALGIAAVALAGRRRAG
jgi:hypothetical protein